jgi:hypothetical protein
MMRSEKRGRVGWAVIGTCATPVPINDNSSQGSGRLQLVSAATPKVDA